MHKRLLYLCPSAKVALMHRTHQKSLWVLLGVIVVGVVIYCSQPKDPVYEGHKLSAWLMALNTGQDPLHARADEALKTIGTNMIPTLIQWIRLKDSPLKLKLMELVNNRQSMFKVKFTPASEFHLRAVIAFQESGARAKAAIPALASLLDDSEIASDVTHALAGIGAESVPVLKEALHHKSAKLRASGADALALLGADAQSATPDLIALLSDQFPDVRRNAVTALAQIKSESAIVLPALTNCITDTDARVRRNAVMALGQIKSEPAIVVPALANCMNDADADVRQSAIVAILNYREEARSTVPILLKAINDQEAGVRELARFALMMIDPEAAANAGIK
jgi:HEAT repeat protein